MAKRRSSGKRSTLYEIVPHWVAYVVLGALFLMAIKLVKIVYGYNTIFWQ